MKKVTVKSYAKINLTLDILGVSGGYHLLNSLVCSANLFDKITVKKRKDGQINLKMKGLPVDCDLLDNNAFKVATLFKDTFNTPGVDIIIEKHIPVGGGLGGSSADIAGVLTAMQKLFNTNGDLGALANKLSSDAFYMLKGGYAVMQGRGDKAEWHQINKKLYFIVFTDKDCVSSRVCYKTFDEMGVAYSGTTNIALDALKVGDDTAFFNSLKNDLYEPAKKLNPNIEFNFIALKNVGAPGVVMTGSGSATVGVFLEKKQRDAVYKILSSRFGKKILKAETV